MNQNVFSYTYCAEENREVLAIRKKYLPPEENPLEELSEKLCNPITNKQ